MATIQSAQFYLLIILHGNHLHCNFMFLQNKSTAAIKVNLKLISGTFVNKKISNYFTKNQ